jgi:hypothetical protein
MKLFLEIFYTAIKYSNAGLRLETIDCSKNISKKEGLPEPWLPKLYSRFISVAE